MGERGRGWVFTINNYSEEQCAFIKDWKTPQYLVVGKEKGANGTPHLQGYAYFANALRASSLQRALTNGGKWPGAWHSMAFGGPEANKKYCSKEDLLVEHGEAPTGRGANLSRGNSSLSDFRAAVARGSTADELWETHTSVLIRHVGGAQACITHYANRREKPVPRIFVAWGSTGTGKSKWAADSFGRNSRDVYWVSPGWGRIWWGGYTQQETVIFDDFTPSQLPLQHFKLLCDRYSYRVEPKGGQLPFTSTNIVFTSNVDPALWYRTPELEEDEDEHWKAVQRRIGDGVMKFGDGQDHLLYTPIKKELIVDLSSDDDDM